MTATPLRRMLLMALVGGVCGVVVLGPLGAALILGFAVGPDLFGDAGRRYSPRRWELIAGLLTAAIIAEIARRTILVGLVERSFKDPSFIAERRNVFDAITMITAQIIFVRCIVYRVCYYKNIMQKCKDRLNDLFNIFKKKKRFEKFVNEEVVYDEGNVPKNYVYELLKYTFFNFIIAVIISSALFYIQGDIFSDGATTSGKGAIIGIFMYKYVTAIFFISFWTTIFQLLCFYLFDISVSCYFCLERLRKRGI